MLITKILISNINFVPLNYNPHNVPKARQIETFWANFYFLYTTKQKSFKCFCTILYVPEVPFIYPVEFLN